MGHDHGSGPTQRSVAELLAAYRSADDGAEAAAPGSSRRRPGRARDGLGLRRPEPAPSSEPAPPPAAGPSLDVAPAPDPSPPTVAPGTSPARRPSPTRRPAPAPAALDGQGYGRPGTTADPGAGAAAVPYDGRGYGAPGPGARDYDGQGYPGRHPGGPGPDGRGYGASPADLTSPLPTPRPGPAGADGPGSGPTGPDAVTGVLAAVGAPGGAPSGPATVPAPSGRHGATRPGRTHPADAHPEDPPAADAPPEDTRAAGADAGPAAPDAAPDERGTDAPAGHSLREWLGLAAQIAGAALLGAAVWLLFSFLWHGVPVVALVLAVLVTLGLVLGARALRRPDDSRTTLWAVVVGLLVTVSPAVVVLLAR